MVEVWINGMEKEPLLSLEYLEREIAKAFERVLLSNWFFVT